MTLVELRCAYSTLRATRAFHTSKLLWIFLIIKIKSTVNPGTIQAWGAVFAKDATLRKKLRALFNLGVIAFLASIAAHFLFESRFNGMLAAVMAISAFAVSVIALVWNNILVGTPICPACEKPIKLYLLGFKFTISKPESLGWCPHCIEWFKYPTDSDWPIS